MDLETENRIASILMKEAAELRRQAEKDGVNAYLRQPNVRGRPNSRFLTATVLGVQQANRAVEVNEMWRVRQKELQLDDRLKDRPGEESSSSGRSHGDISDCRRSTSKRLADSERNTRTACSSSKRVLQDCYLSEDEGLKDDEVEEFLHSRVKRGRGAIGSRTDETGPYLPPCTDSKGNQLANSEVGVRDDWDHRVVLGPEKPFLLKYCESSEEESLWDQQKKEKKVGSRKQHSKKHRSKEKAKDKKKKRWKEEKRCKRQK